MLPLALALAHRPGWSATPGDLFPGIAGLILLGAAFQFGLALLCSGLLVLRWRSGEAPSR